MSTRQEVPLVMLVTFFAALPVAFMGCADHAAPANAPSAASSPPAASAPAATASAPAPAPAPSDSSAAAAEADAGAQGPLEREAAQLDAAMRRARERIAAGGAQVDAAARDDLAAMEKRYTVVRAQLGELGKKVGDRATTVGKETKSAAESLKKDLNRLADRLTR